VNDELGRMWKENNGLFSGSVPAFAWRNWGKSWEISVKITGLQAKNWTWVLI
jgi:hypothetical protein